MHIGEAIGVFFKEDTESVEGWEKATVEYLNEHRSKIYSSIRGRLREFGVSYRDKDVADDIYSDLIMCLYKYDDYDVARAYQNRVDGKGMGIEGYINQLIKYCIQRYSVEKRKDSKMVVRDTIKTDEGEELSLIDWASDKKADPNDQSRLAMLDEEEFKDTLDGLGHLRYRFGVDIFELLYVNLKIQSYSEEKREQFEPLLEALGIGKKKSKTVRSDNMDCILRGITEEVLSFSDIDKPLKILRDKVYMANRIDDTIDSLASN